MYKKFEQLEIETAIMTGFHAAYCKQVPRPYGPFVADKYMNFEIVKALIRNETRKYETYLASHEDGFAYRAKVERMAEKNFLKLTATHN